MLFCGLRRLEVAELKVEGLDLKRGEISFHGKGGRPRIVPVPPFLVDHLRELLHGRRAGPVFYSHTRLEKIRQKNITPDGIQYIVRAAGRRASVKSRGPGLVHLNAHTLRHTFARRMKEAGMPWEDLALLMGHKDVKTTLQIYGTRSYEEVRSAYLAAVTELGF
jgi:integrase